MEKQISMHLPSVCWVGKEKSSKPSCCSDTSTVLFKVGSLQDANVNVFLTYFSRQLLKGNELNGQTSNCVQNTVHAKLWCCICTCW